MIIGLDLSVIQTPHRMRGIGATAINFVNNLSPELKKAHKFVLFLYKNQQAEALELLELEGVDYEVRNLDEVKKINLRFPGRLKIINGMINNTNRLLSLYTGDSRIRDASGLDVFLQFDQMAPLPKAKGLKRGLILYDIIPYVLESEYLWSYKTARAHKDSRKSAVRKQIHRRLYKYKTRVAANSADLLIAISEHTKADFVKYIGIKSERIEVVHLGVTLKQTSTTIYPEFKQFIENSWGYFPVPIELTDKPFLLFIGGADPRRRLNDLVAAYNNLKAEGVDIRLIFAGDSMKGPHAIPIARTRQYISSSSYLEDIIFLGFVTDEQKNWLYQNAIAFIFPSVYEGFGLPILEAMQYGCPTVVYKNSSIPEIVKDATLYAETPTDIYNNVKLLLDDQLKRKLYIDRGIAQSKQFMWQTTCNKIIGLLMEEG